MHFKASILSQSPPPSVNLALYNVVQRYCFSLGQENSVQCKFSHLVQLTTLFSKKKRIIHTLTSANVIPLYPSRIKHLSAFNDFWFRIAPS